MQQRETSRNKYNRKLWDINNNRMRMSDIHLIGVPKGEMRENGDKQYLKRKWLRIFRTGENHEYTNPGSTTYPKYNKKNKFIPCHSESVRYQI